MKMIYDLLKEVRGDISDIKKDMGDVKVDVARNTDDMAHHIKRTDVLQELHSENQVRIEKLEEPSKAKKWLKSQWLTIGSLAAAGASILGLITKVMGLW